MPKTPATRKGKTSKAHAAFQKDVAAKKAEAIKKKKDQAVKHHEKRKAAALSRSRKERDDLEDEDGDSEDSQDEEEKEDEDEEMEDSQDEEVNEVEEERVQEEEEESGESEEDSDSEMGIVEPRLTKTKTPVQSLTRMSANQIQAWRDSIRRKLAETKVLPPSVKKSEMSNVIAGSKQKQPSSSRDAPDKRARLSPGSSETVGDRSARLSLGAQQHHTESPPHSESQACIKGIRSFLPRSRMNSLQHKDEEITLIADKALGGFRLEEHKDKTWDRLDVLRAYQRMRRYLDQVCDISYSYPRDGYRLDSRWIKWLTITFDQ